MNLRGKKILAGKALNVGIDRIKFDEKRIDEIKEAITKQDIRDLFNDGAIKIKPIKGKKTLVKRTTRRRIGKIRKKVKNRKREYVIIARKLRKYIKELKAQKKIDKEQYQNIRKQIKMRTFKNKRHMKEVLKIK